MRLPNAESAFVDIDKLRDYCLSTEHPQGKHKARVFAASLGLTAADAKVLQAALYKAAQTDEAVPTNRDEFGQRYVLDFEVTGPKGGAILRSAWIVRPTRGVSEAYNVLRSLRTDYDEAA